MRSAIVALALVFSGCSDCDRTDAPPIPPAPYPLLPTEGIDTPPATDIDASLDLDAELHDDRVIIRSQTCGFEILDGFGALQESGAAFACELPDGSVAFSFDRRSADPVEAERRRCFVVAAILTRGLMTMSPDRIATERRAMAADDARGLSIQSGLILRAPQRHIRSWVVIEGEARDVQESGGATLFTVTTDLLGNERFMVAYQGIAPEWVVNRSRVRLHGLYCGLRSDSESRPTPEVAAFDIEHGRSEY